MLSTSWLLVGQCFALVTRELFLANFLLLLRWGIVLDVKIKLGELS
jgi:hypothetical protein